MTSMSEPQSNDEPRGASGEQFTCDFCGESAPHVRRVALDRDYDRLQKPHHVQYACDACSAEKERQRLERDGG